MYNSIHIQNFRGFRDLKIDDLRRVNLIAGKNNVGKTSLLDAIAILTGNFDYYDILKLSVSKMGDTAYSPRILFHNGDIERQIQIESGRVAVLELVSDGFVLNTLGISNILVNGKITDDSLRKEYAIRVQYLKPKDGETFVEARPSQYLVRRSNTFVPPGIYEYFCSLIYLSVHDDAAGMEDDYSTLALKGEDQRILEMVQLTDQQIIGLNILTIGSVSKLHARYKNYQHPLSSLGEGVNRVLAIALGLSKASNGVLLIDEIENGLHYSVMQDVWRAIGEAARQFNVQIFATTHSMECIIAAKEAFEGTDDLSVIQMARNKDGDIEALTYDERMLTTAFNMGLEVR